MNGRRKLFRALGWGAIGLIAAAATLVCAALVLLSTPSGQGLLRAELEKRLGAALAGELKLEGLRIRPTGELLLTGVELRDPDGGPVARIEEVGARLDLRALLDRKVHVEIVRLEKPALHLVQGPSGLNLSRALAPRHEQPAPAPAAEEQAAPLSWHIGLDQLTASDLRFDYRSQPQAPPDYAVEAKTVSATGSYGPAGAHAQISLQGSLKAPLEVPLRLDLAVSGGSPTSSHDPLQITVFELHAGSSRARLTGELRQSTLAVQLEELRVEPRLLAALAPGSPIQGVLDGKGEASVGPDGARASLRIRAGKGELAIDASADFAEPFVAQAALKLERASLEGLLPGVPPSELTGTARARFMAGEPAPGRAEVELDLAGSRVRGVPFSALRLKMSSEGARGRVESLVAAVPGGELRLRGDLASRFDLRGTVRAADLERFSKSVARAAAVAVPELAGEGQLTARLRGRAPAFQLAADAKLSRFAAGAFKAEGLALDITLPDLKRPFVVTAGVTAARGALGELPFSDLRASVQADRRQFSARLASRGHAGVYARIRGEVEPGGRAARLDRLRLVAGEARWQLREPVRLTFGEGFATEAAVLESGDQEIGIEGGLVGSRLALTARVRRLDLGAIPDMLVPARLGLAGRVDADAKVSGTPKNPVVDASAQLEGVGGRSIGGVSGRITAQLVQDRLRASARLQRKAGSAQADLDLPLALLSARPGTKLSGRVHVEGESLEDLGRALGIPELKRGFVGLAATLEGTSDRPRLQATLRASGVGWARAPDADVELRVAAAEETAVTAGVLAAGSRVGLEAKAPLSLAQLAAAKGWPQLEDVPIQAVVHAPEVVLERFAGSLLPRGLSGVAALQGRVSGTLGKPRGDLHLSLARAALGAWSGLGLGADLSARDDGLHVSLVLARSGQVVADLTGRWGLTPEQLGSEEAIQRAPLEAALNAGPGELAQSLGELAPGVAGWARGALRLSGTLASPMADLTVSASDLVLENQKVGRVELKGWYADRVLRADASVKPAEGPGATLEATLAADLGFNAMRRGVDLAGAPLHARLDAEALELKLLQGPLSSVVRRLEGRLDAQLDFRGSLREPGLRGRARIRGARVALVGYGAYREVNADLSVTVQEIRLEELTARAGSGQVAVKAQARRASQAEPYRLDASLRLDALPLVVDDRVVAILSGHTERIAGQIHGSEMSYDVRLARLVVRLPKLGGDALQSLQPHPDIRVVDARVEQEESPEGGARASSGGMRLRLHLDAPRDVWIESEDLRIEVGADLSLAVADAGPELTGEIHVREGKVEVLGRRFELARGLVSYAGDPPENPRVDVQAIHENTREQVKVKVGISGTAQKPRIELSSEPPLEEGQIATLLATGRKELKRGTGGLASGSQAASVLGSFAAEGLRKVIASQLPLDVLQVEVGEQGIGAESQDVQLEAGTYLTDRLYVGYRRNFGAHLNPAKRENPNEVRIEYQISPRVSVESSYGDEQKGGADVVYSRDY